MYNVVYFKSCGPTSLKVVGLEGLKSKRPLRVGRRYLFYTCQPTKEPAMVSVKGRSEYFRPIVRLTRKKLHMMFFYEFFSQCSTDFSASLKNKCINPYVIKDVMPLSA